MGYYTRFYFQVRTPVAREYAEQIINRLNAIMGCEDCFTLPDSEDTTLTNWNLELYNDLEWYDWEENMSQLSKEFPDVEFCLEGNGENKDDRWIALFSMAKESKLSIICRPMMSGKIEIVDFSCRL